MGLQPVAQRLPVNTAALLKSGRDELGSPEVAKASKETSVKHIKGHNRCSTKKVTWPKAQMNCLCMNTHSMG